MQDTSVINGILVALSVIFFILIVVIFISAVSNFKPIRKGMKLLKKAFGTPDTKGHHLKRTSKKGLDQIIDSYLFSEEENPETKLKNSDFNNRYQSVPTTIRSEVLQFLSNAEGSIHHKEIMSYLSNIFPDTDSNTFMTELAKLERGREIKAGVVGGDIHYQMNDNRSV